MRERVELGKRGRPVDAFEARGQLLERQRARDVVVAEQCGGAIAIGVACTLLGLRPPFAHGVEYRFLQPAVDRARVPRTGPVPVHLQAQRAAPAPHHERRRDPAL